MQELMNIETGTAVLDNVINKLQIYMEQNNQTLYGLASKMGFSYQPFYRIITKKHLPTIDSLVMIASHFNCTVAELIADTVFCDVSIFNKVDELHETKDKPTVRIYIPYIDFIPVVKKEWFCLQNVPDENILDKKASDFIVFYKTDIIDIDGVFLVKYKNKIRLLNVVSVSSKYVVIEESGAEIKVEKVDLCAIARFFNFLTVKDNSVLTGVIK